MKATKASIQGKWLKWGGVQVVKGLRGGVQDVALKMLIGETHYHVNSFRQVPDDTTAILSFVSKDIFCELFDVVYHGTIPSQDRYSMTQWPQCELPFCHC